jgi:hypothetical protein
VLARDRGAGRQWPEAVGAGFSLRSTTPPLDSCARPFSHGEESGSGGETLDRARAQVYRNVIRKVGAAAVATGDA